MVEDLYKLRTREDRTEYLPGTNKHTRHDTRNYNHNDDDDNNHTRAIYVTQTQGYTHERLRGMPGWAYRDYK